MANFSTKKTTQKFVSYVGDSVRGGETDFHWFEISHVTILGFALSNSVVD